MHSHDKCSEHQDQPLAFITCRLSASCVPVVAFPDAGSLSPRAGCRLKVDSSLRTVTCAAEGTSPSEEKDGRTGKKHEASHYSCDRACDIPSSPELFLMPFWLFLSPSEIILLLQAAAPDNLEMYLSYI